jgi:PDZ domain-containing protein
LIFVTPVPFAIETPGPTYNVFQKNDSGKYFINVNKNTFRPVNGELRFITVSVYGASNDLPIVQAIYSFFDKNYRVLPASAVFDTSKNANEQQQIFKEQMKTSENTAITAAKNYLNIKNQEKITYNSEDIGGPSAGMMYTLALISILSKKDLTGNNIVAGTGTISADGKVGAIGGIRQKMISSKRDGAKYFIGPYSNCDEIKGYIPNGLEVFVTENIKTSIEILKNIKNKEIQKNSSYKCP